MMQLDIAARDVPQLLTCPKAVEPAPVIVMEEMGSGFTSLLVNVKVWGAEVAPCATENDRRNGVSVTSGVVPPAFPYRAIGCVAVPAVGVSLTVSMPVSHPLPLSGPKSTLTGQIEPCDIDSRV